MDTLGFQIFSLKIGLFGKNDPPGGYRAGSHHVTRQFLKELPLGGLKNWFQTVLRGVHIGPQ